MLPKRKNIQKKFYAAGVMVGAAVGLRELMKRINAFDFHQKVMVITGGSRGLGLELAMELFRRGAIPILLSGNNDELQRAKMELSRISDNKIGTYVCDIRNRKNVEEVVNQIVESYGGIDPLINNAGIIQVGTVNTMSLILFE